MDRRIFASAAAALIVMVAGCGDENKTKPTPSPPSKEVIVKDKNGKEIKGKQVVDDVALPPK